MNYGKAIKTIRATKGITQKELSRKLKLNPSYISRIEKGDRKPSIELLELIASKLQIPFYLFMLLSSEEKDIRGFDPKDIEKISKNLLQILLHNRLA
ncbi:MAG: helix-turn-helix transcriptional regulator [Candidatus Paceibacterota bacterium]